MYYKITKKEAENIYEDAIKYSGYSVIDYVGYYCIYENEDQNIAIAVNKSKDDFDGREYFSVYASYEPDQDGQWFFTDSLNKDELVNLILEEIAY